MALKYLCDLNINDNVLQNARVLATGTAPTALSGAIFVDTSDSNKLKYCPSDGASYIALGTSTTTGDITQVEAGAGLTGGGDSGDVTLTVGSGTGITVNADDVAVTASQTGITSMYNTGLLLGRASNNGRINFSQADKITFITNSDGQGGMQLTQAALTPNVTNTMDIGTSSVQWKNAYFDGTVTFRQLSLVL